MNYLKLDDNNFLEDLTRRKEFYQFYKSDKVVPADAPGWVKKYDLSNLKEKDVNLEPQSYQSMVANFLNPFTPYSRLLLKWDPGMGKTIAAINIAMQFIKLFERESQMEDQQIGSVFVIGFTEEIFKRELLSFPKFGFINRAELEQLQHLKEQAHMENKTDIERLQEFMAKLKKRLGSRKENGYFKFFGYKAFVNRIFILQDFKRNINDMTEVEIRNALKDGSLKWNKPLLDSFKNSVVICDEIHNVYNSLEKNNWGVALQTVLDHDSTTKAVYMSATPINNNPTEVVDLGNLMQTPDAKLRKEDYFDTKILKPGALERIAAVFRGRVSFIQDTDARHFATQTIIGETIEGISYLKFIRCPMSKFHYQTYEKVYTGVLAQDAQYLMDFVLPNPLDATTGLYKTTDIKRALSFASDSWFKVNGFKMQNDVIIGPGLYEDRIGEWSSKYHKLLQDIKSDLTPNGGKILVYHDVVHVSGVLFIEQLLQHNGFISIDQNDTADTLCAVCGVIKKDHQVVEKNSITGGRNNWKISAPGTADIALLKAMYLKTRGREFLNDMTACNTKTITIDNRPVAFLTYEDEDASVARIDALIVDARYQSMGMAEYLLENYTPADKILTVVAPETDTALIDWYTERYFREYDRCAGDVYLSFDVRPISCNHTHAIFGGVKQASRATALKHLQKYDIKLLVPRYADQLTSMLAVAGVEPPIGSDIVPLLINSADILVGYIIVQTFEDRANIVHTLINADFSVEATTLMLSKYLPSNYTVTALMQRVDVIPAGTPVLRAVVTGGSAPIKDHEFMPARYIVAHSDVDKNMMYKHIDRFNAVDNTWGYQCRIIVGSKIIKEGYNFTAIRKVKIAARPANTATLIQILGRSRRKKAHLMLPSEYRDIEVKIYTSCLPVKDDRGHYKLSHEEIKYREKIEDYKIIQLIEQKIHENAIDSVTARNIILPGLNKKNPGLGALWFEPAQQVKTFKLRDLNLSTFEIFHSGDEIRMQIYIIKRLYIEMSVCFKFDQLWEAVRNPPFPVEQDTELLQIEYFVIALSMLVFGTHDGYVRPITHTDAAEKMYLLDVLHSDIDKRIMQSDGTVGYIHHMETWYVFVPFRNGKHDIYTESPFRTFDLKINRPINITRYLKESTVALNYENQKLKFKSKYENVALEKLATVVGKFGISFHQAFVEELIKYIFNLWTDPSVSFKSELHEFYFKMLYYYDLMGLIVWASTSKEFIREMYKSYMLPIVVSSRSDRDEIHSLEMSLNRSQPAESLKLSKTEYTDALKQSLLILTGRSKTIKKKGAQDIIKADPTMLPIGHFMSNAPRFYHPDKDWFASPEYVQRTQEYKENDTIVGYYEKSGTGLRVKFKIRTPIHKIHKYKDIRMIEKGSICSSNSKQYLIEIAKQLKLDIPEKINVPNLCHEIESQLQLNELLERKKKSNVKWFYAFWESRPDERRLAASSISTSI